MALFFVNLLDLFVVCQDDTWIKVADNRVDTGYDRVDIEDNRRVDTGDNRRVDTGHTNNRDRYPQSKDRYSQYTNRETDNRDRYPQPKDRYTNNMDRFTQQKDRDSSMADRYTDTKDRYTEAWDRFTDTSDRYQDQDQSSLLIQTQEYNDDLGKKIY